MRAPVYVALLLLLTGCRSSAPLENRAQGSLNLYDGFEQKKLNSIWSENRFVEGAAVLQRNVVRTGHQAIAMTLRSRDKFEAGRDGDLDTERDELLEETDLYSQQDVPYEYTFSQFFPADFPIVPTRLVIAQWKQYCGSETSACSNHSPVLAFRYIGGEFIVTQTLVSGRHVLYSQGGEFRNRWHDFRVRARFSPDPNGHIAVWLDGKQVVDFHGITANPESAASGYSNPSTFFFKMGLYRDLMPAPMTVYIDEYRKRELKPNEF